MATERHPQHNRAFMMLVLATIYWGLTFPQIKSLLLIQARILPPGSGWFSTVYVVAPRYLLATLILIAVQGRKAFDLRRGELIQGTVIALFASAGMLFQNDGLGYTAASTSAFLTQFYAIMIPIWLALRHRRNPGWLVWISCVLVLIGVSILGHFDWRTLHFGRGEWETLVASTFFMGQILWLDKKEYAENRPEKITLVLFAIEAVIFCLLAGVTAPSLDAFAAPWRSPVWIGFTLVLTLLGTIGAYSIMNRWQPKLSATEAGLIYCIEPIFGSVMAIFLPALFSMWAAIDYPNEKATWTLVAGGGLITVANILIQLKPAQKRV